MKTEYLKLSPELPMQALEPLLGRAGALIAKGGLVVFPTETVYGLGADATNEGAARAIYAAKGRPSDNPLIVHIASPEDAELYAHTGEAYRLLAKHFMPGPLTVILPVRDTIPHTVTAGLPTVAIRCPAHPIARALIKAAGKPIAAPSANLSGSPSPTCFRHVREDMDGRVDLIIDGGDSEIGIESTIVKLEENGSATLLRPGHVTAEELRKVLGELRIAEAVTAALKKGETVLSPGMKYRHYAPSCPVILLKGDENSRQKYISCQKGKLAALVYTEHLAKYETLKNRPLVFDFGSENAPEEHAKRLFYLLREADKDHPDAIFAPLPKTDGLFLALYNRMIRAAAYTIIELS